MVQFERDIPRPLPTVIPPPADAKARAMNKRREKEERERQEAEARREEERLKAERAKEPIREQFRSEIQRATDNGELSVETLFDSVATRGHLKDVIQELRLLGYKVFDAQTTKTPQDGHGVLQMTKVTVSWDHA